MSLSNRNLIRARQYGPSFHAIKTPVKIQYANNTTAGEKKDALFSHVSVLISLFELNISVYQGNRGRVLSLYFILTQSVP